MDTVLIGFFSGLAGSVLGAWLALTRYRLEKWWDKKAETYITIFNALNEIRAEAEMLVRETYTDVGEPNPLREAFRKSVRDALTLIEKQTRVGSLILSERAVSDLKVLLKELDDASRFSDWNQFVDARWNALTKAIDNLQISARSDLKVGILSRNII